jgi:hypothetical protein
VYGRAGATSGETHGVEGQADAPFGRGVYGYAGATSGPNIGVQGETNSTEGFGVYGYATATSGATHGVYGLTLSPAGVGVHGYAQATDGLTYGVYGQAASPGGRGVYGLTTSGSGGTCGVYGFSQSTAGYAVYGYAGATSGSVYGVFGRTISTDGRGVAGHAVATSGLNYGVLGRTDSTEGYGVYSIGDFGATGSKAAIVPTQAYGWRHLYTVESPDVLFEDAGTAQLVAGQAVVTIDPVFAQTVNLEQPYQVLLTAQGDCGLYVAAKQPASFTVRALDGKTCSTALDYRIIAKRLGYEGVRLAPAGDPPWLEPAASQP